MGSSSKTVKDSSYIKMFPEDVDLWNRAVNQYVANAKSIDSAYLSQALMQVNDNFNYAAFSKLDGATYTGYSKVVFDESDIPSHITDTDYISVLDYNISDTIESYGAYWLYQTYGAPAYGICTGKWSWNVSGQDVYPSGGILKIDPNTGTKSFDIYLSICDGTVVDTQNYAFIESNILIARYDYSGTQTDPFYRNAYLLEDDMSTTESTSNDIPFLTIPYKTNFKKNTDRYIRALNARLGIPNRIVGDTKGTMLEAIEDDKVRDMILTYAFPMEGDYEDIIKETIGSSGYVLQVKGAYIRVQESIDSWKTTINGVAIADPDDMQFPVPLQWLMRERTLRQKHTDLKNGFTMLVAAQDEIEVAWYQTGFFKILTFALVIVYTIYTGDIRALALMMTSYAINAIIDDPFIAQIINTVIAVYTFDVSAVASLNTVAQVLNIIDNLSRFYFIPATQNAQDTLEDLDEKTEEAKDRIAEMTHEGLYIPLDSISNFYDNRYSMQYEIYNMMYDYDKIYYTPSILKNYNKGLA